MLQINVLGCLHLRDDQAEQETLPVGSERSQALLAYLLLHRTSPQPRQQIAGHLWPNLPEAEAKKSLRRELYRLRQLLPIADDCLQIETKTLQWTPVCPYWLDVEEFELSLQRAEAAVQSGDLQLQQNYLTQATTLYRGDLLPACYDDWTEPLREQFHQQVILAFDQLIHLLLQQQDHVTAQPLALHLLQMEPLHEGSYCALMQSYQACGNRAAALQIYHQCMTLLREELGIDPSPTTQQLYQQVLNADNHTIEAEGRVSESIIATPSVSTPATISLPTSLQRPKPQRPLVGRTVEKQVLQSWLTQREEAEKVLLLVGEPGIGKTRLLEELMVMVPDQMGAVIVGRGFEAEMLRPYGVWIDALRNLKLEPGSSLPPELGLLLPELGTAVEPLSDRGRLFDAVITLLDQLAERYASLVVTFDDIQWLDEASVSLLHYGIRRLRSAPVRFACSARRQELEQNPAVSSLVQTLQRDQRLQRLDISSLDKAAILALIQTMGASINGDRIYSDSGGNPLFALEAVRAFHQQGQVDLSTLQALIANRLKGLEPNAQSLLPWAAALGRQFEPMRLAQVTDSALMPLLTALEHLEVAGIILPSPIAPNDHEGSDGQGYDFAHDVLRQVVYESVSAPVVG
ncbi:MAG: BTAD domain-containing putative transcriptional regulator [Thainema sp.]